MAVPKIIADFETQLSTAIAVSGTTFSISSATDDDGVSLPAGLYYFTIDNGSSSKEYLAGTLSGTSVTGVVSVSRQGAETSGAVRAHRVGASVIITDFATYKKYMDEISIAGGSNASLTLQGMVELPTTAEINAGTATGATGAGLAVTPDALLASDYGLYKPTSSQKAFLNATTGCVQMFAGSSIPTGFLACDGSAISRATYAALFTAIGTDWGVGDGSTTFNIPDLRGRVAIGSGTGTKVATFASRSSNVITVTGLSNAANNEFQTGQAVLYSAPSGAMTGLTDNTTYYLIRTGNLTFSLATTLALAQNGTAIALSSDGTGTQTFTLSFTARTLGQTGGEENHAMSVTELLAHVHTQIGSAGSTSGSGGGPSAAVSDTGSTGGNAAMNNMQPFGVMTWIIKT